MKTATPARWFVLLSTSLKSNFRLNLKTLAQTQEFFVFNIVLKNILWYTYNIYPLEELYENFSSG